MNRSASIGLSLALFLGASVVDARSAAAQSLAALCTSAGWIALPDPELLARHFAAFPLTSLWMSVACFHPGRDQAHWGFLGGLWRNAVMVSAMAPAGAMAQWLAASVRADAASLVYVAAMAALPMLVVSAARFLFDHISNERARGTRRPRRPPFAFPHSACLAHQKETS